MPDVSKLGPLPTSPRFVIGHSVQNRPIEALRFGSGAYRVLLVGTIHGNEPAGALLTRRLVDEIERDPSKLPAGVTLLVIHDVNPDGSAINSRRNVHNVDLNRNFPADNFKATDRHGDEPLSQPEAMALFETIHRFKPDRVVVIHQPLRCIDYDGPATELATELAALSGLPLKRLGSRPGSLGSYVGLELGKPIITVELARPEPPLPAETLWEAYEPMMWRAVTE